MFTGEKGAWDLVGASPSTLALTLQLQRDQDPCIGGVRVHWGMGMGVKQTWVCISFHHSFPGCMLQVTSFSKPEILYDSISNP